MRACKVWTPERVALLRELSHRHRMPEIARKLGVSYYAVTSKLRELRLLDTDYAGLDLEHVYSSRYVAPLDVVRSIGVGVLSRLSHEERRLALFRAKRAMRQRKKWGTEKERIERMLELSARITAANKFLESL